MGEKGGGSQTSVTAISYAVCSLSFWCIALLWILINYGKPSRTIFVMIYVTVSSILFIFLSLSRSKFMTMACTSLTKISEDMANAYKIFHLYLDHSLIGAIKKEILDGSRR